MMANIILPISSDSERKHITVVCDSISTLDTVVKYTDHIEVKHKHTNLISLITALSQSSIKINRFLPINLVRRHILVSPIMKIFPQNYHLGHGQAWCPCLNFFLPASHTHSFQYLCLYRTSIHCRL